MRLATIIRGSKLFISIVFVAAVAVLFATAANLSTSVTTTPAVATLTQNQYRWYGNIDALNPSSTLAAENTATSTPAAGTVLRLRMNVSDGGVQLDAGNTFLLQYANVTSGPWTDLSTSTSWIFFDNPSVADGQIIVSTLLSTSDVGESYGESNPSAATPTAILPTQSGEWDWVVENNNAATTADWFFRMMYSSSTLLDFYANYPALTAVPAPPAPVPSPSSSPSGVTLVGSGGGGTGYSTPPSSTPPSSTQPSSLPIPPPILPPRFQCADFSGDNRIDIIDLSILLYHYHETGSNLGCYDLNKDDAVNFPDISILMFYWTE